MFCVRCGAKNLAEASYCFNCGARLAQSNLPASDSIPSFTNPAHQPSLVSIPDRTYTPANGLLSNYAAPPPFSYPSGVDETGLEANAPLLKFHPLAEGAVNLPRQIETEPARYYSYVDGQERLVFARRASLWQRVAAALLDVLVLSAPYFCISIVVTSALTNSPRNRLGQTSDLNAWVLLLNLSLGLGYFFFTSLSNGQSLGKRALKIRVIRLDGQPPDPMTAFLRYVVGYMLSTNILLLVLMVSVLSLLPGSGVLEIILGLLTFGWGFWWCGLDELRQGWHDKLARTLVVATQDYVEGVHFYRAALG